MGGEAGAEGGEPVALIRRGSVEALLQGHQHGGAAHVAAAGEDRAGLVQRKRQHIFQGLDDIASAGVGDDLIGIGRAAGVERGDGFARELRDGAVQLVLEFPLIIAEADFFAVLGPMRGGEMAGLPLVRSSLARPDRGRGTIAEQAEADEHAWVVIDKKSGGANFHGDHRDLRLRMGGEVTVRRAHGGDGGTAAEAHEIAEIHVIAQSTELRDVRADARAKVAGAGAEKNGIEIRGVQASAR